VGYYFCSEKKCSMDAMPQYTGTLKAECYMKEAKTKDHISYIYVGHLKGKSIQTQTDEYFPETEEQKE
jgi:hypothetical protein